MKTAKNIQKVKIKVRVFFLLRTQAQGSNCTCQGYDDCNRGNQYGRFEESFPFKSTFVDNLCTILKIGWHKDLFIPKTHLTPVIIGAVWCGDLVLLQVTSIVSI